MTTCPNRNIIHTGGLDPKTALAGHKGARLQSGGKGRSDDGAPDAGLATKTRTKAKRPSLYRVLLLNDDYTPMEFVVAILRDVFNRNQDDAIRIMMLVHNHGVGECGVYPYEVAETKVTLVMDAARRNQHPLQCVMEKL
ncbi:MAG: ATP-dependent Clp protease adapter ClpS [Alphaproteobacteria bacterium]|nr:ATP-dependent Clp protease adapter ClpS [Alphaproteobacteria bacterium]